MRREKRIPIFQHFEQISLNRIEADKSWFRNWFIFFTVVTIGFHLKTRFDVALYNVIKGPFHVKEAEFSDIIKSLSEDERFFLIGPFQKELYQVELKPDSFRNYLFIQKLYSGARVEKLAANYMFLNESRMYLKIPLTFNALYETNFPYKLKLFSVKALKCVIENLPEQFKSDEMYWLEKYEMVQFLEGVSASDRRAFNRAAIKGCSVVIGFLTKPGYSIKEYFSETDVILNMKDDYFNDATYTYFTWLTLQAFAEVIFIYLCIRNAVKYMSAKRKISRKSFTIDLPFDLRDQLQLLNIGGSYLDQLKLLEDLIDRTPYQYLQSLALIQIEASEEWFVIVFNINLEQSSPKTMSSTFIICPVSDIIKISQQNGIEYDSRWIPWPRHSSNKSGLCNWLHEKLMKLDKNYAERFRNKVKKLRTQKNRNERLARLIREEKNYRCSQLARANIVEILNNTQSPPADEQFIAKFRLEEQEENQKYVKSGKYIFCTICQTNLDEGEAYSVWPCAGGHEFHNECIVMSLRSKNSCPNCREEVPAAALTWTMENALRRLIHFTMSFRARQ